ncbi:hypothetical protein OsJ_05950 [Oryza sativa Japonica Group]|uniref:Uncharacterized protein n=1 Tax=Oryza sativa subsp. japonica TaxID=39947 RepID=B9F4D3_ORYSJ|nr:hypothetical protein OsJ_05950 [Oryza sativa Japonica Group]
MAASGGGNGVVVVFDFDKTIIDCDSDNWVVDALGATARFDDLLCRLPWNSAIDAMMGELHAEGRTVEEVAASLRAAPLSPRVAAAVETARALGCELRVLSDANAFFVGAVLDHHGLAGCFSAGKVMERIIDELSCGCGGALAARRRRVVYVGDGRGDYCPSLKLTEMDYVMPRKGYPVWDLIAGGDRAAVRADVREWADFEDLEAVLLGIVAECLTSEHDDADDDGGEAAPPAECRALPATLASGQEAILPKAVHVPN